MHRRTFITTIVGLLIPHRAVNTHQQDLYDVQTVGGDRPPAVDLGSGITLVDYRLHPGTSLAIIGEIRNDTDVMIDSPTVSITHPTTDGSYGFSWLSPTIPVMREGESVPVFGPIPNVEPGENFLDNATFALCTIPEPGPRSEIARTYDLDVEERSAIYELDSYRYRALISNLGNEAYGNRTLTRAMVWGIVRDSAGRIAGVTPETPLSSISAGRTRWANVDGDRNSEAHVRASPFPLLHDSGYSIELRPGSSFWDSVTSQGCAYGLPWE